MGRLATLVEDLVSGGLEGGGLRAALLPILRDEDCAQLLRDLRDDPEYSFVAYEAPPEVCSKPKEMLAWLLERLVFELREERAETLRS